jgi:energy-coupling factor transporter ATP-binding protein EcfA2
MQSEIVILDEPQAGLDPHSVDELIDQINSLANKTILVISHDYDILRATCERIITMESGKIISDMPVIEFI